MKIYFVRHQAAGFVTKYPFLQSPSESQIAAVSKECFQSFGFGHPKTPDEPYWVKVVEFDALGPDEVPEVPERDLALADGNEAGVQKIGISGTGTVTNP